MLPQVGPPNSGFVQGDLTVFWKRLGTIVMDATHTRFTGTQQAKRSQAEASRMELLSVAEDLGVYVGNSERVVPLDKPDLEDRDGQGTPTGYLSYGWNLLRVAEENRCFRVATECIVPLFVLCSTGTSYRHKPY